MDLHELTAVVEAILFSSGEPVSVRRMAQILGVDDAVIGDCAERLAGEYGYNRRGIRLIRLDGSWQMCSAPEYSDLITRILEKRRPPKLSQPALEVLAIVAYFQPVTRAYIDQVRGVDSAYTVGVLHERGLIETCGRLDVPGRPMLYQTGSAFLRTMGISSLEELPQLPDLSSEEGATLLRQAIEEKKAQEASQLSMMI